MMYRTLPRHLSKTIFLVLMLLSVNSQAQVCRVSTSGTSSANGTTWQQSKSLISALNNPISCPEIWVKSGVYYPTSSNNRTASFSVPSGVKLFGGFYGTETSRVQRDYLYNKATLSGNIGAPGVATDNSYHVIYLDATSGSYTQSTVIDGFVIKDGYANQNSGTHSYGGGMFCDADGSEACSPLLQNLTFIDNTAKNGGAIYNRGYNGADTRPIILTTEFINNQAINGGSGGAIYNDADGGTSSPNMDKVLFRNNSAAQNGGAIASYVNNGGTSQTILSAATLEQNTAQKGGAVFHQTFNGSGVGPIIYNSTMHDNSATQYGGAIYNRSATTDLNNVTIADNSAGVAGGGIRSEFNGATDTLTNSILWGNQAPSGSQVFMEGSDIDVAYSVIQNNCSGFGTALGGTQNCTNILTTDPQLGVLQNNRGFTETMMPGVNGSAIGGGDNNSCLNIDQRGILRPQDGQCDIGAVEVLSICRVTTNGSVVGNGSNWTGQAMNLQTALSTNTCQQIWIKAGTYTPTNGTDRTMTFTVNRNVIMLGGFAGTENNPSERDIPSNQVILSGNIGNTSDMTDNSFHVLTIDGTTGTPITATTWIADLEIHHGYASESFFAFPDNSGAGLYCAGSGAGSKCSPFLSHVRFYNNQALGGSGGGMFNDAEGDGESSPNMVNVTFDNNEAANGGGMYNFSSNGGNSSATVVNGNFLNNTASNSGGAVYNNANGGFNRTQFTFGQFFNNTADYGGAVYLNGQNFGINTTSFNRVSIFSNQASIDGGAIYSVGWDQGQSKPLIQDVIFESNLAQRGGAVFLNDLAGNGTAEINRVTFNQNLATDGGALYNDGENGFSHPKITNVTFHNNVAIGNGGAVYNNGDNGASSPNITNATFSNNSADRGGAMYSTADPSGTSSPVMRHIIMWNNTANTDGDTIYHNLAESNLFDSVIQFGCPNFGFGNTNCNNIIENDPLLGPLSSNGGYSPTMALNTGSSAIDAGDDLYCPGEDQRGDSRPQGAACDIGAVEVFSQRSNDVIFKDGFD